MKKKKKNIGAERVNFKASEPATSSTPTDHRSEQIVTSPLPYTMTAEARAWQRH
jgi:hypothetical protein